MREAQTVQPSSRPASRPSLRGRTVRRAVAAGAIIIASLAAAGPSWAGPLTGC